jgi:hypothetical protein
VRSTPLLVDPGAPAQTRGGRRGDEELVLGIAAIASIACQVPIVISITAATVTPAIAQPLGSELRGDPCGPMTSSLCLGRS